MEALNAGLLKSVLGTSDKSPSFPKQEKTRLQGCRYLPSLKSSTVAAKLHAQMLYCDTPRAACTFTGAGVTADFRGRDGLLSPTCGLQSRRSL